MPDLSKLMNQSILVTGATGSFGRRFIATVLERFNPERLIVFSRDELKQFEMQQTPALNNPAVRYFIGDVRDADRLEMAMRGVNVVIHAAALKQVPAAEYNPFECIRTNVHGAENVVHAAIKTGVQRVIALSTDKAANPINLYGASKLASDKIFIAGNNLSGDRGTRFSVVRYGNVMGSRGSIIDFFNRLIADDTPSLPITDPRMTRFTITLQQGVDFVISCLATMKGGEIFVPKIPSIKIIDIATAMAPDRDTHVIGIRPGEKLHELMISEDDSRTTLEFDDYYLIEPAFAFWSREHLDADNAVPVDEGFFYRSDTNTEWLNAEAIATLLKP